MLDTEAKKEGGSEEEEEEEQEERASLLGPGRPREDVNKDAESLWHGVGVSLFLNHEKLSWLALLCFVLSVVAFAVEQGTWDWWVRRVHVLVGVLASLATVGWCVTLQWQQIRLWTALRKKHASVVDRSILVSSPSLQGSMGLVPTSQDLAKFFSEKYGSVENVLIISDIGKLVRLRRLRADLRFESLASERQQQRWRPRKGWFARLACCRMCRNLARKAGEKKQDRFQRWMDRLEDQIIAEEENHQVESTGCAIVTFEHEADARTALRDTTLGGQAFAENFVSVGSLKEEQPTPGSPSSVSFGEDDDESVTDDEFGMGSSSRLFYDPSQVATASSRLCQLWWSKNGNDPREVFVREDDHAGKWFFSPSLQSRLRFGDDLQPLFVRMPPESDDINFESFRPHSDLVSPSKLRTVALLICGTLFGLFGVFFGSIVGAVPGNWFWDLGFVLVAAAILRFSLLLGASRGSVLPERTFATFSLRHRDDFRVGFAFFNSFFVPFFISVVSAASTNGDPAVLESRLLLMFFLVLVFQSHSVFLAFAGGLRYQRSARGAQASAPSLALGYISAETLCMLSSALLVSPWLPFTLLPTSALLGAKSFVEKSRIQSFRASVSPLFGPDVAVSFVNTLPLVALLICGLPTIMVLIHNPSHYSLDLFIGIGTSIFVLAFSLAWMHLQRSRPYLFRYPTLSRDSPPHVDSGRDWKMADGPESMSPYSQVNISFGETQNAWNSVLSASQTGTSGYLLPDLQHRVPPLATAQGGGKQVVF